MWFPLLSSDTVVASPCIVNRVKPKHVENPKLHEKPKLVRKTNKKIHMYEQALHLKDRYILFN